MLLKPGQSPAWSATVTRHKISLTTPLLFYGLFKLLRLRMNLCKCYVKLCKFHTSTWIYVCKFVIILQAINLTCCRWQDFVVTEIDTQGKLVVLIKSKICSANEDDKGHQTINRKGNGKERTGSKECSEEKSVHVERETPFLSQV